MPRGFFEVPGPPVAPLPYGLFSVSTLWDATDQRWEVEGLNFETLTNVDASGDPDLSLIAAAGSDPNDQSDFTFSFFENMQEYGSGASFGVQATATSSAVGGDFESVRRLAERRLIWLEEKTVESFFETGDADNKPNFTTATALDQADNLLDALATIEGTIGDVYGARGVIHMSRKTATRALKEADLHTRGGRLYTGLDTPIAVGAGYDFDGLVLTPEILIWRSEMYSSADLLSFPQNNFQAVARRMYAIGLGAGDIFSCDWATD